MNLVNLAANMVCVKRFVLAFVLANCLVGNLPAQQVSQSPSPMIDRTRPHPRVAQQEVTGRRVDLKSLPGARLFISPGVNVNRPVPVLVHFHGAPWLVEFHIASDLSRAALITVQLGSGSSVYGRPFEQAAVFKAILDEASSQLGLKQGWSSITLSAFSAGYGAVRQILRNPELFNLVNNVLLLDGMHASYSPEGKLLADGGLIEATNVDSFVSFAKEAILKRKIFVLTHSEIFPGAYASTTECADYLLAQLNLTRRPDLRSGPMGMQQLSSVDVGGFHLRGYAGNSAQDHVDHFQAMSAWFKLLRVK